ncbi:hypothetical protein EAE96_008543 [Botrytis aclada]|nr:hypothetical protein EAE96_008543 [Botrytis aclada]
MFHKIRKTFQNHTSGKQKSGDVELLLRGSEQLRPSHQSTHQSSMNASPTPSLSFGRRRNDRDSRSLLSQRARVPRTPQFAPSSSHHSARRSEHSSSRSIQSNENGRPSTSTRTGSVVSRSSSHHTTANVSHTKRNSGEVIIQDGLSGNESRSSHASSRDEPHSSIPRSIIVEQQRIRIPLLSTSTSSKRPPPTTLS